MDLQYLKLVQHSTGCCLTSIGAGSQKIDNVLVVSQVAQDLQFRHQGFPLIWMSAGCKTHSINGHHCIIHIRTCEMKDLGLQYEALSDVFSTLSGKGSDLTVKQEVLASTHLLTFSQPLASHFPSHLPDRKLWPQQPSQKLLHPGSFLVGQKMQQENV